MRDPDITELPRFVQVRAYDKGAATASVTVVDQGKEWHWSRPLIDGTRLDARDVADYAKHLGMDEAVQMYCITPEMIQAAIDWRTKHPRWRPRKTGEQRKAID